MTPPAKFYRYEDIQYDHYVSVNEYHYYLIKETPCGYWISLSPKLSSIYNKRWISKTSRKRFAYPTRIEAQESFKARKKRQIKILSAQLERAKGAISYFERNIEGKNDTI